MPDNHTHMWYIKKAREWTVSNEHKPLDSAKRTEVPKVEGWVRGVPQVTEKQWCQDPALEGGTAML